jgi:hypothetical protein
VGAGVGMGDEVGNPSGGGGQHQICFFSVWPSFCIGT